MKKKKGKQKECGGIETRRGNKERPVVMGFSLDGLSVSLFLSFLLSPTHTHTLTHTATQRVAISHQSAFVSNLNHYFKSPARSNESNLIHFNLNHFRHLKPKKKKKITATRKKKKTQCSVIHA